MTRRMERRSQQAVLLGPCLLGALWACSPADPGSATSTGPLRVADGHEVSLEYTLRIDEDEVYDTNVGGEPLVYTHGRNQLVKGLEKALEGMAVGDTARVEVAPAEGYGEGNPLHVSEIPKELIPPDARVVGAELQTAPRHGQRIHMRVKEVKEDTIVMDLNHPLAGRTLYFEVKVLEITVPRRR